MTPPLIVGVDPGARETGVIARCGNVLRAATLVTKAAGADTFDAYLTEVLEVAAGMARTLHAVAIAVEDVTAPTGFADGERHPITLGPLLLTAQVLGAVRVSLTGVIVVDAGGNGSSPIELYPSELVGPLERVGKYGKRRHLRSAWDIAARGALELRANVRR